MAVYLRHDGVRFWLLIGVTSGAKSKFSLVSISCACNEFQFCKGWTRGTRGSGMKVEGGRRKAVSKSNLDLFTFKKLC